MQTILKLRRALSANVNTSPEDVLAAKTFLQDQGFYNAPEWGISEFPDRALFKAIETFQKNNNLRVDGVMKPEGETEAATQLIQAQALKLQSMGRNGDTILAHITPGEAMLLKEKGGAGTVNPKTGLLEFSKKNKKKGKYIWHTVGDGKVRSSHEDRDGKEFSWDEPPEDGHPGEAYNCRCSAEDIDTKEEDCKVLKHKKDNQEIAVQEAEKDWAELNDKYEAARVLQIELQTECDDALKKALEKGGEGVISGVPGGAWGVARGAGTGALPPLIDGGQACIAASVEMEKVNALLERRNSAEKYMETQRRILSDLRIEYADSGCDS